MIYVGQTHLIDLRISVLMAYTYLHMHLFPTGEIRTIEIPMLLCKDIWLGIISYMHTATQQVEI